MKKINFPSINKGNFKIAFAIIGVAVGLLLSSVFVFEKINNDKKVVSQINAQNCGQGTFQYNGCTACYKVGTCGGALTYDCGSICLSPSCGSCACQTDTCDGCSPAACDSGYTETNTGCTQSNKTCNTTWYCSLPCTVTRYCYRQRYAVNLTANGGTGTNCKSYTTSDGPCGSTSNTAFGCTRTGYTLSSYSQTGCGGTWDSSTGVCSNVTGTLNVTANWTANTYQVSINANGGSCSPGTHSVSYGYASSSQSCSRTGYTFSGFSQSGCGGSFNATTGVCSSVTQAMSMTASWTINSYQVSVDGNGGSCSPGTHSVNYGSASSSQSCSRTGYTFSGFSQSGCGGSFNTTTGVCSSVTQAMSMTASWMIRVTYWGSPSVGGSLSPTYRDVAYGSSATGPTVSTNTGYVFVNFSIASGSCAGTFTASTGTCSNVQVPITIQANWMIRVTYWGSPSVGGSLSPTYRDVWYGSSATGPTVSTNTGYTFYNFSIASGSCAGTFTASTGTCDNVQAPITIQANWMIRVSYTKNISAAGSLSPTYRDIWYGSSATGPTVSTNTGYTFVNFSITSGSCAGTFTASTGTCDNVQAPITIQANWTINSYQVTVDANGGSCSPGTHSVSYGSASSSQSCSRSGYTFSGFTQSGCGGSFNATTGVCSSVTNDMSMTANWNIHVSYTENIGAAGSLSPTYRDVAYGSSATGPTVTTNTGYVFVNFSITSGSCAGTFTPSTGTCSNVQVPITIQANWNIRVSYTENIGAAGSLSPTYRDVAYGASATGPTVSTNTGYTFVNFSITSGSCAGTFTASTGTCDNVQAPITIQANWILNTYQVTVDPSGGSCSPGTHSVNHGSASSSQSCSRTGYTLSGFTQSGCGGTFNTTTGVCSSVTQAMSITANWTLNTYQVTVNANGGSCDPGTHTVDHGNQSLAQTCSRGGYTFSGFTQSGCGGSFNTSTGECSSVTSAMTITATWSNIAPAFSATPYEAVASYSTSPTSIGSSITFRATATDANANYYLIICSTNSVTPGASGAAPSCGSTKYCNSSSTASGSQASCSYTTNSGNAWSNPWYAFVCDNNSADPKCSSANQGSGNSGSPFYVNHPPTFSNITITDSSQNPTESVQWNATASDSDGNTVKLLVCKTNAMSSGSCTGGAWCTSSLSTSNPSCSYTIPTPTPDGSYDAWVYVVDQFNLGASGTGTKQGSESDFTVNNVAPVVSSVALNSGNAILLNENTTTQIQLSATVTDANGCGSEIPSVLGYVYRSGISFPGCDTLEEANQNYCYPEITCSENSGTCSGSTDSSAVYNCNVAFNYYADPTDNGTEYPEQNWLASVKATDNNGATQRTELSTGVELNSLPACEATPNIDYGSLKIEMIISPLSIISTISSTGNVGINHNISGSNMCTNYPACTWGTPIAVTRQRYSLNSSTIYPSGTILTSTPTFIATKLPKQRTSTKETVDIWWGISIPTGIIAGDYNGEVFLTPIKSDVADW